MGKLSIATLPLVLSDGDRADLEKVRQRIAQWAGAEDGPTDNVIVYAALLRLVQQTEVFERTGNSYQRDTFAKSFYVDDLDEDSFIATDIADEEFPSDPSDRFCPGCGEWLYLGCECNDNRKAGD